MGFSSKFNFFSVPRLGGKKKKGKMIKPGCEGRLAHALSQKFKKV